MKLASILSKISWWARGHKDAYVPASMYRELQESCDRWIMKYVEERSKAYYLEKKLEEGDQHD